jgi:hypothetical protein
MNVSHIGSIKPMRIPHPRRWVVGFDTEDDSKGNPLLFAFHDGESSWVFVDPKEAVNFILTHSHDGEPVVFFAHNLEYDLGNLMKCGSYAWVKRWVNTSILLSVTLEGSKNTLQNSQAFFSGSVKEMGEIIGLPKLPFDPNSREYVVRDAEIVQRFVSAAEARMWDEFGMGLGVSLGQTSAHLFMRHFVPKAGYASCNNPELLGAFYGGRTEIFHVGTHEGAITDADIKSSYPFAMAAYAYPDCRFLERSRIDTHEHGVGRFTVRVPKVPYPALPWRSERGGVYYPTGTFSGVWTYADVRRALAQGATIVRESAGIGTDLSVHPFKSFVDLLYGKKARAKDRFSREFYKILLNAGYGKLLQVNPERVYTREKPAGDTQRVGPFWESLQYPTRTPLLSNYMWGVHVTAYARLHLLDQIESVRAQGATPLYCDTDSVIYSGTANLKFGDTLGALGRDNYDAAFFRLAKGYVLCRKDKEGYVAAKVAAKGVPPEHGVEYLRKGVAAAWKPVRLRGGLVRSESDGTAFEAAEGLNVWRSVKREVRREYLKRPRINGGQETRAPDVKEVAGIESARGEAPEWKLG